MKRTLANILIVFAMLAVVFAPFSVLINGSVVPNTAQAIINSRTGNKDISAFIDFYNKNSELQALQKDAIVDDLLNTITATTGGLSTQQQSKFVTVFFQDISSSYGRGGGLLSFSAKTTTSTIGDYESAIYGKTATEKANYIKAIADRFSRSTDGLTAQGKALKDAGKCYIQQAQWKTSSPASKPVAFLGEVKIAFSTENCDGNTGFQLSIVEEDSTGDNVEKFNNAGEQVVIPGSGKTGTVQNDFLIFAPSPTNALTLTLKPGDTNCDEWSDPDCSYYIRIETEDGKETLYSSESLGGSDGVLYMDNNDNGKNDVWAYVSATEDTVSQTTESKYYYKNSDDKWIPGGTTLAECQDTEKKYWGNNTYTETCTNQVDSEDIKQPGELPECGITEMGGCIVQILYYILYVPTSWAFAGSGMFFDVLFDYSISSNAFLANSWTYYTPDGTPVSSTTSTEGKFIPIPDKSTCEILAGATKDTCSNGGFITVAWSFIRDLCNITFIITLLYSALMLVLGMKGPDEKRLIRDIFVWGILLNFSLFFAKIPIDIGNVATRVLYKSDIIQVKEEGTGKQLSVSEAIVRKVDPQAIVYESEKLTSDNSYSGHSQRAAKAEGGGVSNGAWIVLILIATVINVIGLKIFLSIAFAFLGRVIDLWVILIMSPIAFTSKVLVHVPFLNKLAGDYTWNKWISNLTSQSFMAPIFMVFLYLVLLFIEQMGSTLKIVEEGATGVAWILSIIIPFIFIITMMNMAKKKAIDMSGDIGKSLVKGVDSLVSKVAGGVGMVTGGALVGATAGLAAKAGRATIGRAGSVLSKSKSLEKWENSRFGAIRSLGSKARDLSKNASEKSFDFRETSGFGSLSKTIAGKTGINIASAGLATGVLGAAGLAGGQGKGGWTGVQKRKEDELKKYRERIRTRMTDDEVAARNSRDYDERKVEGDEIDRLTGKKKMIDHKEKKLEMTDGLALGANESVSIETKDANGNPITQTYNAQNPIGSGAKLSIEDLQKLHAGLADGSKAKEQIEKMLDKEFSKNVHWKNDKNKRTAWGSNDAEVSRIQNQYGVRGKNGYDADTAFKSELKNMQTWLSENKDKSEADYWQKIENKFAANPAQTTDGEKMALAMRKMTENKDVTDNFKIQGNKPSYKSAVELNNARERRFADRIAGGDSETKMEKLWRKATRNKLLDATGKNAADKVAKDTRSDVEKQDKQRQGIDKRIGVLDEQLKHLNDVIKGFDADIVTKYGKDRSLLSKNELAAELDLLRAKVAAEKAISESQVKQAKNQLITATTVFETSAKTPADQAAYNTAMNTFLTMQQNHDKNMQKVNSLKGNIFETQQNKTEGLDKLKEDKKSVGKKNDEKK